MVAEDAMKEYNLKILQGRVVELERSKEADSLQKEHDRATARKIEEDLRQQVWAKSAALEQLQADRRSLAISEEAGNLMITQLRTRITEVEDSERVLGDRMHTEISTRKRLDAEHEQSLKTKSKLGQQLNKAYKFNDVLSILFERANDAKTEAEGKVSTLQAQLKDTHKAGEALTVELRGTQQDLEVYRSLDSVNEEAIGLLQGSLDSKSAENREVNTRLTTCLEEIDSLRIEQRHTECERQTQSKDYESKLTSTLAVIDVLEQDKANLTAQKEELEGEMKELQSQKDKHYVQLQSLREKLACADIQAKELLQVKAENASLRELNRKQAVFLDDKIGQLKAPPVVGKPFTVSTGAISPSSDSPPSPTMDQCELPDKSKTAYYDHTDSAMLHPATDPRLPKDKYLRWPNGKNKAKYRPAHAQHNLSKKWAFDEFSLTETY
jgi:chromosome segregation ATPase